jgi:hypothetical protein
LYGEYDVYGDTARLSNKFVKLEVEGGLVQYRYCIGKLINAGEQKLRDLKEAFWENVKTLQATEDFKKKIIEMSNRARGRKMRNNTR